MSAKDSYQIKRIFMFEFENCFESLRSIDKVVSPIC
jgi:hypothetical protein